jgi:hypothetical protein
VHITDRIGFPNHIDLSRKLFQKYGISTILDLGAGKNPQAEMRHKLSISQLLLDLGYPESDEELQIRRQVDVTSTLAIKDEISKLTFSNEGSKLDAVVSIQNIEHLEREVGLRLLDEVELIASKLIIFETPNGFVAQEGTKDNPFQAHLSGWNVKDFKSRGYKVYGTSGLKILKKNSDKGAYRVNIKGIKLLDVVLSRIFLTKYFPGICFNLFAFKDVSKRTQ